MAKKKRKLAKVKEAALIDAYIEGSDKILRAYAEMEVIEAKLENLWKEMSAEERAELRKQFPDTLNDDGTVKRDPPEPDPHPDVTLIIDREKRTFTFKRRKKP